MSLLKKLFFLQTLWYRIEVPDTALVWGQINLTSSVGKNRYRKTVR